MRARRTSGGTVRLAAMVLSLGFASVPTMNFAMAQTAQYDGVYAGTQTLTSDPADHNYAKCLKGPFKRKMAIKNGAVTYTYNPTYDGEVTGTVTPNGDVAGSVVTSSGGVALVGKIQGDAFTGKVWSIICTYSLDLKRVP
jgi:hypothetical protein